MKRRCSLAPESDDEGEIVMNFSNDEDEEEEDCKPVDVNDGEHRTRVLQTRFPILLRLLIFAIVLTMVHLSTFWVVKWPRPCASTRKRRVFVIWSSIERLRQVGFCQKFFE